MLRVHAVGGDAHVQVPRRGLRTYMLRVHACLASAGKRTSCGASLRQTCLHLA
jgi:hypothetical protein